MTTRELYCEGNDDAAQLLTATLNGRNRANVTNEEIRRMYAPNESAILLTHDDDFRRIHQHWINRPARLQLIPAHGEFFSCQRSHLGRRACRDGD